MRDWPSGSGTGFPSQIDGFDSRIPLSFPHLSSTRAIGNRIEQTSPSLALALVLHDDGGATLAMVVTQSDQLDLVARKELFTQKVVRGSWDKLLVTSH